MRNVTKTECNLDDFIPGVTIEDEWVSIQEMTDADIIDVFSSQKKTADCIRENLEYLADLIRADMIDLWNKQK